MAGDVEFKGKGQALRLGIQQELGGGPLSIFGAAAQKHDMSIREVTAGVLVKLSEENPNLEFQLRTSLSKKEAKEMAEIMLDVARTSLRVLGDDLDFGDKQK